MFVRQTAQQLIIVDTFHYNESNSYRLPCKTNSAGYENNHFKVKKENVNSVE